MTAEQKKAAPVLSVNHVVKAFGAKRAVDDVTLDVMPGDIFGFVGHNGAGALVHQPTLLVLDEPFVGLDPEASFHVKEMLRELADGGSAVFFSSHVLEVVEKLCNKVAIIKQGTLRAYGPTADVVGDESLEDVFLDMIDRNA